MTQYVTLEYKKIPSSESILMDVYSPSVTSVQGVIFLPIVMFFHGGALTAGNRRSYFPHWLKDRVLSLGYAFISADYRLLIPTTAKEIVEDICDAFNFVANNELPGDGYIFKLDGDRIAVSGNSSGGLCARLAAIHARPRPKVLIDIYGQGGNFFRKHHVDIKRTSVTLMRQLVPNLNRVLYKALEWPYADGLPTVVTGTEADMDTKNNWNDSNDDPRATVYSFLFQEGKYLDYFTGLHDPSISTSLRQLLGERKELSEEEIKRTLPENKHNLFPQLSVDPDWPPTVMVHGVVDDTVPIEESRHLYQIIRRISKSPVKLIEVEGEYAFHGWDCFPESEQISKIEFDTVKKFLEEHL